MCLHTSVGVSPEKRQKVQRDGAPLLWRLPDGAGTVQPGVEKAQGRLYSSLSVPEGGLQEIRRGTFYKSGK